MAAYRYYKKEGGDIIWFTGILNTADGQIINPSHETLLRHGWMVWTETLPTRTLEDAKTEKSMEIYNYDNSTSINEFYVNGSGAWFDKETRSNFRGSLSDAVLLGETEVSLPLGGNILTIPVSTARILLAQIQRYADTCTIITSQHVAQVQALETIEEVDAFDITADYPEKLSFQLGPQPNTEPEEEPEEEGETEPENNESEGDETVEEPENSEEVSEEEEPIEENTEEENEGN